MKKVLSLILATALAVIAATAPLSALAQEGEVLSEPFIVDNPFYAGREIPSGSIDSATDASVVKSYKGANYYTPGKSLYNIVKNKCVARTEKFSLNILSKGTPYNTLYSIRLLMDDLWSNATDDSIATGCKDGDYLRWQLGYTEITSLRLKQTKDGYYFYTMTVEPYYYSTAAQEKTVDNVVNNFIFSTDTSKLSDYEIIQKIHDFICSRTTYDSNATDKTLYDYAAYGALVKGLSVCQGYSNAFYRLCREFGYKTRILTSDADVGCHAWNIVRLDGKYYFVDVTWDDEIIDNKQQHSLAPYYFFLTDYSKSLSEDTHFQHVIEPLFYDNSYFNDNYRKYFTESSYDSNNPELLSRSRVSLSAKSFTYDGGEKKPAVTVTSGSGAVLTEGKDYTVVYTSNVNCGYASALIYGKGSYNNDSTRRLFIINPSKPSTPWVSSREANAITLKWNANSGGVSGYAVEIFANNKWSTAAYVSKNEATISSLSPAAAYKFRIRAYKSISARAAYSAYGGSTLGVTAPLKPSGVKLSSSKNKITAKWSKVTGTGYQLQYSLKKNMKSAKTINITGAKNKQKGIKGLKSKKKYYVRVRAFKKYTEGGKTKYAYGAWSAKKSIKCK